MRLASWLDLAESLYGALVKRLFRDPEGADTDEMIAAFRDLCRTAWRERGLGGALLEAMRSAALAVACAAGEWRERRGTSVVATQPKRRRGAQAFDELLSDFRQGLRSMRRYPGLSGAVVATLGIALGANATVLGVANAVLFERLPYHQPERVVSLQHRYADGPAPASVPSLMDYRRDGRAFEQVAASAPTFFNLTGAGEPERMNGLLVTANFFDAIGVRVARGRGFSPGEEQGGEHLVALVSDALWRGRFAAQPALLGSTIELNGRPHEVIGIMPPGFRRGRGWGDEAVADIWAPLPLTAERRAEARRSREFLDVYARLRHSVTLQQARAGMGSIVMAQRERFPERYGEASGWNVELVALDEEIAAPLRPLLTALLVAVGALLLVAATGVSGLLLARAASRARETSVRVALGASQGRLVRQVLTESAVLTGAATLGGLLLGRIGVGVLEAIDRVTLPRAQPIELDTRVLVGTLVAGIVVTFICGLAPAWHGTSPRLMQALRARSGHGRDPRRVRRSLVVVQTALALALLAGTGLLVRSLGRLGEVDPGFRVDDRLSFQVLLPRPRYQEQATRRAFVSEMIQRLEALPGVRRAGAVSALPLSGSHNADSPFEIEGRQRQAGEPGPHAEAWSATPGYFATLGIPLLRGRLFDARDAGDSPRVVVASESLAATHWPGDDPVGRRIAFTRAGGPPEWAEIIGVVGDVSDRSLDLPPRPQLYAPYAQVPYAHFFAVVHAARSADTLVPDVRIAVQQIDAGQPIHDVMTLEHYLLESLAARRAAAATLAAFAMAAVGLAALGLYGVTAFSVRERYEEIGVRMALGAQTSELVRLFMMEGLGLTVPGTMLGLALALGGSRLIEGLVFGVDLIDPLTYALVSALLIGVGLAACAVPAWRATRVDPLQALRAD